MHTPSSSAHDQDRGLSGKKPRLSSMFTPPEKTPERKDWIPDHQKHICMVCQRERFTMVRPSLRMLRIFKQSDNVRHRGVSPEQRVGVVCDVGLGLGLAGKCSVCCLSLCQFNRRHHCRRCGRLVCHACSSGKMVVEGSEEPVRVCDQCYSFFHTA